MSLTLRDATSRDLELLAWVQVEAARSHRPLGFWDLAFPGLDEPRLELVARIADAPGSPSFAHRDGFIVAELDGRPVGALSGYDPKIKKLGHFIRAMDTVLEVEGWSEAHRTLIGTRLLPILACLSDTPDDRWVVEWVALRPEARGQGLLAPLLDAILERGREAGFAKAQITYLIGNVAAKRGYERAGFVTVDEKRSPEFEAVIGAPGTARMWMDLERS